jgi:putative intracellular protease/amidase
MQNDRQGATQAVVNKYHAMAASPEMQKPLSWSAPNFTLDAFDLVLLPGGHDKGVRQVIDSPTVHKLILDFFPQTRKPGKKAMAAICHGVMVLSESKNSMGESAIRECTTTTLPAGFERSIYWGTWAFLGDYYKTYGAGSDNTEDFVSSSDRLFGFQGT